MISFGEDMLKGNWGKHHKGMTGMIGYDVRMMGIWFKECRWASRSDPTSAEVGRMGSLSVRTMGYDGYESV
jgi:hypothetical protein